MVKTVRFSVHQWEYIVLDFAITENDSCSLPIYLFQYWKSNDYHNIFDWEWTIQQHWSIAVVFIRCCSRNKFATSLITAEFISRRRKVFLFIIVLSFFNTNFRYSFKMQLKLVNSKEINSSLDRLFFLYWWCIRSCLWLEFKRNHKVWNTRRRP